MYYRRMQQSEIFMNMNQRDGQGHWEGGWEHYHCHRCRDDEKAPMQPAGAGRCSSSELEGAAARADVASAIKPSRRGRYSGDISRF